VDLPEPGSPMREIMLNNVGHSNPLSQGQKIFAVACDQQTLVDLHVDPNHGIRKFDFC